ncbi:MAG: ribosome-associated translation inhibitor RaiA [Sphingobacteriales bacterium]|nr:ribosome-associated translation inhibitor RaiA [Sphingobacteriales bacterium]
MNLNIHAVHFAADGRLLTLIEKKVERLRNYFDKILDVEVFLKLENLSSPVRDKVVSIKVHVPGGQFFAEEQSKLFEEAVELSMYSLRRQITKHKEKLRP